MRVVKALSGARGRVSLPAWLWRPLVMAVGLFVFILALQLLKKGAGTYGRDIIRFLQVTSTANSLGFIVSFFRRSSPL